MTPNSVDLYKYSQTKQIEHLWWDCTLLCNRHQI